MSVFFFELEDEAIPNEFLHAGVFFFCGVFEEFALLFGSADDVDVDFVSAAAEACAGFRVKFSGFFCDVEVLFFCSIEECLRVAVDGL